MYHTARGLGIRGTAGSLYRARFSMRLVSSSKYQSHVLHNNAFPRQQQLESFKYRRNASTIGGPLLPGQIGPQNEQKSEEETSVPEKVEQTFKWRLTGFKMLESAATTLVSIIVLG